MITTIKAKVQIPIRIRKKPSTIYPLNIKIIPKAASPAPIKPKIE